MAAPEPRLGSILGLFLTAASGLLRLLPPEALPAQPPDAEPPTQEEKPLSQAAADWAAAASRLFPPASAAEPSPRTASGPLRGAAKPSSRASPTRASSAPAPTPSVELAWLGIISSESGRPTCLFRDRASGLCFSLEEGRAEGERRLIAVEEDSCIVEIEGRRWTARREK